jgi:hypothetical protein
MAKTRMYLDGHTYSLFDPEEVHRDLQQDPQQTRRVMNRSKQILTAHEFCNQCRDINARHVREQGIAGGYASLDDAITAHAERVTKYVISRANLARMLQLGPGERITRMFVSDDPYMLHVIIAGEHFDPVPDGRQIPVAKASRLDPGDAAAAK